MTQEPFLRRPLASHDRALLDAAGVGLVVLERGEAVPDGAGFTVLERGAVTVARNDRAWPRIFFCATARETATDSAAIDAARVIDAARGAAIPPSVVAITAAQSGRAVAGPRLWWIVRALWPGVDRTPPPPLRRDVPVVADSAGAAVAIGRATLAPLAAIATIMAPAAGWVVLLEADFRLGGHGRRPVRPRAARLRASSRVAVPAGAHAIAWRYQPVSFALQVSAPPGARARRARPRVGRPAPRRAQWPAAALTAAAGELGGRRARAAGRSAMKPRMARKPMKGG
jgi:hypothetical protein